MTEKTNTCTYPGGCRHSALVSYYCRGGCSYTPSPAPEPALELVPAAAASPSPDYVARPLAGEDYAEIARRLK